MNMFLPEMFGMIFIQVYTLDGAHCFEGGFLSQNAADEAAKKAINSLLEMGYTKEQIEFRLFDLQSESPMFFLN
jgi:hypothetical protein